MNSAIIIDYINYYFFSLSASATSPTSNCATTTAASTARDPRAPGPIAGSDVIAAPTDPAPSQTPQSPDAEEPAEEAESIERLAGLGRLLSAYALRLITLDCRPTIPTHVSVEELKRKNDPRLVKYFHVGSVVGAGARGPGSASVDAVKPSETLRAGSGKIAISIPWTNQERLDGITATSGQAAEYIGANRLGLGGIGGGGDGDRGAKRSPPHTLPDIVLPPLPPVVVEQGPRERARELGGRRASRASVEDMGPAAGAGALSRGAEQPPPSRVPKV